MDDLSALDEGRGGIDWNGILGGAVQTAGQILVLKQQQQNQTPVPYVSPVQVATPQTGIPIIWLVAGAAALFLLMKLAK